MHKKVFFIVGLIFLLKLSVWFLPLVRDAAGYAYVGRNVANGAILYKKVWDHKPPGVYFLDATIYKLFSDYLFGIRLVDGLTAVIGAYLFYRLLRLFFNKSTSYWSTLIFAVFANIYMLTQGSNLVEAYMVPVLILSYFFFIKAIASNIKGYFFLTGVFIAILFIFKQVGILPLGAFVLFLFYKRKEFITRVFFIMLGMFFALLPVILYFIINRAVFDALDAIFIYNFSYAKEGYDFLAIGQSLYYLLQVLLASLLFWLLVFIGLLRIRIKDCDLIFLLLLIFSFVGTAMGGKFAFSRNYFLLMFPAAGYFVAKAIKHLNKKYANDLYFKKLIFLVSIFILIPSILLQGQVALAGAYFKGLFNPGKRQIIYSLGLPNYTFIQDESAFYRIADYIRQNTTKGDFILDWGAEPEIYLLSKTKAPTRYFYNFPINGVFIKNDSLLETRRRKFMHEIKANKPMYIIANNNKIRHQPSFANLDFPEFKEFIRRNYILTKKIDNYLIFNLRKELFATL